MDQVAASMVCALIFSLFAKDFRAAPEVNVRWRQMSEGVVILAMVAILDEGDDRRFKVALQLALMM